MLTRIKAGPSVKANQFNASHILVKNEYVFKDFKDPFGSIQVYVSITYINKAFGDSMK